MSAPCVGAQVLAEDSRTSMRWGRGCPKLDTARQVPQEKQRGDHSRARRCFPKELRPVGRAQQQQQMGESRGEAEKFSLCNHRGPLSMCVTHRTDGWGVRRGKWSWTWESRDGGAVWFWVCSFPQKESVSPLPVFLSTHKSLSLFSPSASLARGSESSACWTFRPYLRLTHYHG